MGKKKTNSEIISEIKSSFPFKYLKGCVLYLNDIDIIKSNNKVKYMVDLIDNEGYKYYFEYSHLKSAYHSGYELNKFFKRNKYTKDNINIFLKNNNIDLNLNYEIPTSGVAREKFNFIDENNNIKSISWNEIKSCPIRYSDGYSIILTERKKHNSKSKDEVIYIIRKMQSELTRPIDSSDFRKKKQGCIGIRTILKYWDTIPDMQRELGLEVTNFKDKLSSDEYKKDIKNICNIVYESQNRTTITHKDIRKYGICSDVKTYQRYCKKDGYTLKEYLESIGFNSCQTGIGVNTIFSDGEKTVSSYECEFSNFLRDSGFIYNKNYFRNVYYKTLDDKYKGNKNCDYLIKFKNHDLYIELAGILGNKEDEIAYLNNNIIKSKSKEKYRLGLNEKKDILERNNLNYYILLKSDMTIDTYEKIIKENL